MRLDFNVLWVEDQPGAVDAQISSIRTKMEAEGFNFNPTICGSIPEVTTRIADAIFTDEVDLILADWDLGGGHQGQEAISQIRDVAPYKDVVFYSAQMSAAELRRLAFDRGLEGIYCASRQDLVDEVYGVFESLVKKILDLDHTRGIVMGATSDIDHLVNSCLLAMEGRAGEQGANDLVAEAIARIEERVIEIGRLAEKLRGAKSIKDLLKGHMLFSANDRLRVLGRALQQEVFADLVAANERVKEYLGGVIPERNALGHMVLQPEGKPSSVSSSSGREISVDEMRQLRRKILALRQDFRDLLDSVSILD